MKKLIYISRLGEMAEWLNAPVLKTGILKGIWGSNPCFSANCKVMKLADVPSCLEGDENEIGK